MIIGKDIKISNQLIAVCACLFVLSGCRLAAEPMPRIVIDEVVSPKVSGAGGTWKDTDASIPGHWLPSLHLERKWTAIVIHHSGTKNGSAAIFDKWHRRGNYWEGVGYDFVIGNGSNSADGQVEVTFRWRNQTTGAHCGGTEDNWANKEAVGICLVGNFNETFPSTVQMRSLVKLVRFLQKRYGIPKSRIYSHNTTPGARATDCPGRNFSLEQLKSLLEL